MSNDTGRIIYVDMDGVLSDWEGAFKALSMKTVGEPLSMEEFKARYSKSKAWKMVNAAGIDYWANLKPMPDMNELKNFLEQNFLNIKILSASSRDPASKQGKQIWLKNHFDLGDDDIAIVANRHDKQKWAKSGDILIDDKEENIKEWEAAGGIGILHKNARSTIEQLMPYV